MATPQTVRHLNEIRALNALFRHAGMSRADLARALGLNRSTTGNIITGLIGEGLAVERRGEPRGENAARTGRPGIQVQIDPAGASFLGAEIGVDRLTVVVIDMLAQEIQRLSLPFPTHRQSPQAGTERMVALIAEAVARLERPERLRGLCVALPALLASDGTVINGLMLGWRDVKLKAMITDRLKQHFPALDPAISIENDANAFAIAETYRDTTHRSQTVAFLLIENGAGGGIVIGGRLLRGSGGFAGEFGQIVLGGKGFHTGRSKPGHLESYIGKDAVLSLYAAKGGEADLDRLLQGLARKEAPALATARAWGERLAAGLIQVTSVLNPGLIILGGSVAPVFDHVAGEVAEAMRRELLDGFAMPRIEISGLGIEGPALGGALLMHQRMFSIDESAIYASEQPITLFQS